MSAQINLYHPRFLKTHDWLTLGNVLVVAAVCYLLLIAAGGWAAREAATNGAKAAASEAQLASVMAEVAVAKAASTRQPDAALAAELAAAEASLRRREEISRLLTSGVLQTSGFAEYLRGFARAAPDGLWLTGFSIAGGGSEMEIRGSMHNAAVLPEYIRRLGSEKIFQGRAFSALTMDSDEPLTAPTATTTPIKPGGVSSAPSTSGLKSLPAPVIDFVLSPTLPGAGNTETRP